MKNIVSKIALHLAAGFTPPALWQFVTRNDNPDSGWYLFLYGAAFGVLMFVHVIFRDRSKDKTEVAK